ncbi:Kinesin-related protein 4 [Diplonema papillatum]|nr:Kinesin-related protein 4 [Diplonema papillatum]
MSSDRIKVFLRVRPTGEEDDDAFEWTDRRIKPVAPHKSGSKDGFLFQRVWGPESGNSAVAEELSDAATTILQGVNATVIAYGHTSAGKTHTMLGTPEEHGLIVQTMKRLLEEKRVREVARPEDRASIRFSVAYFEIYMEKVFDLLNPGQRDIDVVTDGEANGTVLTNMTSRPVESLDDCERVVRVGQEARRQGRTNLNERSSRSHTVFQVQAEVAPAGAPPRAATLQLVDLAGSENAKAAGSAGEGLREGANINRSLLALTGVISALAARAAHVPFRDSKLTRILQNSLGGNAKTSIICCVSPAKAFFEDAMSALLFADRARVVYNSVRVNEADGTKTASFKAVQELIAGYRQEIDVSEARELAIEESRQTDLDDLARVFASHVNAEAAVWTELDYLWQKRCHSIAEATALAATDKVGEVKKYYREKIERERVRHKAAVERLEADAASRRKSGGSSGGEPGGGGRRVLAALREKAVGLKRAHDQITADIRGLVAEAGSEAAVEAGSGAAAAAAEAAIRAIADGVHRALAPPAAAAVLPPTAPLGAHTASGINTSHPAAAGGRQDAQPRKAHVTTTTPRAVRTLPHAATTPKSATKASGRSPKTPSARRGHNAIPATPPALRTLSGTPTSSKKVASHTKRRKKIHDRTENFYPI